MYVDSLQHGDEHARDLLNSASPAARRATWNPQDGLSDSP